MAYVTQGMSTGPMTAQQIVRSLEDLWGYDQQGIHFIYHSDSFFYYFRTDFEGYNMLYNLGSNMGGGLNKFFEHEVQNPQRVNVDTVVNVLQAFAEASDTLEFSQELRHIAYWLKEKTNDAIQICT